MVAEASARVFNELVSHLHPCSICVSPVARLRFETAVARCIITFVLQHTICPLIALMPLQ